MFKKMWKAIASPSGGAILGVAGILIAVYFSMFFERQGELVIRVDALSRVFDIHRPVGGLEVTYGGENLRTAKKALWVLTASIQNRGNAAVRKNDFDDAVPLGFEVIGGIIAEQPELASSTLYLAKNMKVRGAGSLLALTPAVLEPGDSVQLNVLILGAEATKPTIVASGKVAGQKRIEVVQGEEETGRQKTYLDRLIPGESLPALALRWLVTGIAYVFASILVLGLIVIAVGAPISAVSEALAARKRRLRAQQVAGQLERNEATEYLLDLYKTRDVHGLNSVAAWLSAMKEHDDLKAHLTGFEDENAAEAYIKKIAPQAVRVGKTMGRQLKAEPWTSPDRRAELERALGVLAEQLDHALLPIWDLMPELDRHYSGSVRRARDGQFIGG